MHDGLAESFQSHGRVDSPSHLELMVNDKCIDQGSFQQAMKDGQIPLLVFAWPLIVRQQLVTPIYATHVCVVVVDARWLDDVAEAFRSLPAAHALADSGLVVDGRKECHFLFVRA